MEADTWVEYQLSVQANTHKFLGLEPATDYKVRIKVDNLVGESGWSDYVTARTGIEPTRPGIFTFVASTRTTLDL